jgi:NAD(P)-dependent dehydrogenase (short-subunit alcohol dehydrogenase family)
MRLSNRDALVTGSSQGIGRGIDLLLAEEDADVVRNRREHDQEPRESLEQLRDSGRGGWIINNRALMIHPKKIAALPDNIPAQHLGQPRDEGGAVAFLASDDTSYMTGTTFFTMEVCYGITASNE